MRNNHWINSGPVWALVVIALCSFPGAGECRAAQARTMPEFGKSVTFDKSLPKMSIARMKGKAVLVIFFQSWCPKCNVWAPQLIEQVQNAHGTNRNVFLLAIKTDGGGVEDAKAYLKDKQANLDYWLVGADRNAEYYKEVTGKNELWEYALVSSTGTVVEQAQAGMHFADGPNKGKFALAYMDMKGKCGKTQAVLSASKQYPASLSEIVRCAELGAFSEALKRCASEMTRSKDKAAVSELKQDILGAVDSIIAGKKAILEDPALDGGARYDVYKELDPITAELQTYPSVKEARALVLKMARDPAILKEKAAESAYLKAMDKLRKASPRDRPNILKELGAIGKKFSETKYGKLALAESEG